jgi:hypothetical protein
MQRTSQRPDIDLTVSSGDSNLTTYVVLLNDHNDAEALAQKLLENPACARVLTPPVRGIAFFENEEAQPLLDNWWAENVPPLSDVVCFAEHVPGLPQWVREIDSKFVVEVPSPEHGEHYASHHNATWQLKGKPADLAHAVNNHRSQKAVVKRFRRAAIGSDELFRITRPEDEPINKPLAQEVIAVLQETVRKLERLSGNAN